MRRGCADCKADVNRLIFLTTEHLSSQLRDGDPVLNMRFVTGSEVIPHTGAAPGRPWFRNSLVNKTAGTEHGHGSALAKGAHHPRGANTCDVFPRSAHRANCSRLHAREHETRLPPRRVRASASPGAPTRRTSSATSALSQPKAPAQQLPGIPLGRVRAGQHLPRRSSKRRSRTRQPLEFQPGHHRTVPTSQRAATLTTLKDYVASLKRMTPAAVP